MIAVVLASEANLVRTLITFARWRHCSSCGELVLYIDEQLATEGDFACGSCHHRAASAQAANDNGDGDL
jgi:hypothetical protein